MKHVFLFGYYGFKNSGDDAILNSIIENLKTLKPDTEISVLTYNAEYTKSAHKVNVVSRSKLWDIIRAIRKSDLMISGGGSLLQDITSSRSLIFYLGLIFLGKLFKKKVMFYCNGYGPVRGKINQYFIKKIISKVDLITLRDRDSKTALTQLGITENVHVTADAAFTMKSVNDERIQAILEREKIPLEDGIIGISLRRWGNDKLIKDVISKTIDYIIGKGMKVILLPMKYPDDVVFSQEVYEQCKGKPYIVKNYYSPEEVLGIIGKLDLLVGIRLHSLIYAAIKAVPMVGIQYDPKIKGFLDLVEQENAGEVEKLDLAQLCLSIDKVLYNRNKYQSKLEEKREIFKDKAMMTAEMAINLLEK